MPGCSFADAQYRGISWKFTQATVHPQLPYLQRQGREIILEKLTGERVMTARDSDIENLQSHNPLKKDDAAL